jgi:hypothetical protein
MPTATIEGLAKDMLIVRAQDGSVQRITLGVPVQEVAAGEGLQSVTSLIGRKIGISEDGSEFYFQEIKRPKVMESRGPEHWSVRPMRTSKKPWNKEAWEDYSGGRPYPTHMAARREQAEERQHSHYEVSPIRSLLEDLLEEGGYTEQDGVITSPGKFEGEPVEVLYYYHLMLEGASSDEGEGWAAFEVTPEEAEEFDLSPDAEVAVLTEDESGFVSLAYTTQEDFERFRDSQEEFSQDDFSLGEDED